MANTANIFDDLVRQQVQLERARAGEVRRVQTTVKAIDSQIRDILDALPENYTQRQLNTALAKIDRLITVYYSTTVLGTLEQISETVVDFEVDFAESIVGNYLTDADIPPGKVNKDIVSKKALSQSYQGHRLSTWTKQLGTQKIKSVNSTVRGRAVEGATPQQLASSVSGAVRRSNNSAKPVTEAYVGNASNVSREAVYDKNEEWVREIVWSTILDSRTTVTCGVRSNKRYNAITKAPIDHNNSWSGGPGVIHWGCRSLGIPTRADGMAKVDGQFVSWEHGTKTAIGAKKGYERGDNTKPDGSIYKIPTKDNKLGVKGVRASTDYESWLRRQPKAFVQDTLGVARAELFVNGKQPLERFVVSTGRELTVKQLQQKLKKTG